jgi:hypothetical protein
MSEINFVEFNEVCILYHILILCFGPALGSREHDNEPLCSIKRQRITRHGKQLS